jgi:ubiquinone/menaquinone biosynthesis C-methylase UbiE
MQPKPKHLGPEYGAVFQDESVVEAYQFRPSHSAELFDILAGLITGQPRVVLDVGCGTGNIARPLASIVDRVDAVDISRPMLEEGQRLPGGDAANLNWIYGQVEEVPLSPPYALVTAGQSLHWMAWDVVFPRFQKMLEPGGFLAIIEMTFSPTPWDEALGKLLSRYSTNRDFQPYDLITELEQRGLFTKVGEKQTTPRPFRQTVEAYIESFHSRNGFSRQRMGVDMAEEFDTAVHALVTDSYPDGVFEMQVSGQVTWGIPHAI